MENILEWIDIIIGLGPTVMMPIIITILGLIFGLKFGTAFRSGVTVGIGFMGLWLVLGVFFGELAPVAQAMVERWGINLTVMDAGWAAASAMAWGYGFIVPLVVLSVIALNILMLVTKTTKTLMVDIWNYWHFLIAASAVYFISGNVVLSVIAALVVAAVMFRLADWTAPIVQKDFDMPGVSLPHGSTVPWAVPAYFINKLLDLTPLKDLKADPEAISSKLGPLGEPAVLGVIIGAIIAVLAGLPFTGILVVAITTGGVMLLLPRMVSLLMEGLVPLSEGAREFLRKKFNGREVYLGLDGIILFGHPAVIAGLLLMIPITIGLSIIIPGNRVLPFADLVGLPVVAWSIAMTKGNLVKGLISSTILMACVLLIATSMAPIVTSMASMLDFPVPDGASGISALVVGGQPINWIIVKIVELFF